MNKTMYRLEKLTQLQKRDEEIKSMQAKLNEDINMFMSTELQLSGPATLVDIVKKAIETSQEPLIVKP